MVHNKFAIRGDAAESTATSWITNCLLVLTSLIAGFMLVEISLRLFVPQPMSGSVFEYAPRGYMVNKSKGTALFTVPDWKGTYHFTSPHLRGVRPPPAGAERILVLGDSFTFGTGLSEEDTYVARLQNKIDSEFGPDQVALLNAGIGGSGTADQLAFLEDFGDQISPRAVVVFVSIDDFNRAQRSPLYRLLDRDTLNLEEGTVQTSRLKKLVTGSEIYSFLIQHVHAVQLIRQALIHVLFWSSPAIPAITAGTPPISASSGSADQERLVRALFRRMKAWCDSRGVRLAVINNGYQSYDWLSELLESERIPAFDAGSQVQPILKRDYFSYVIRDDVHPNPKGAALIAEAVWPFVEGFIRDGVSVPAGARR